MKPNFRILFIALTAFLFAAFLLPQESYSKDNTCRIMTNVPTLYIAFYDIHPDEGRGKLLWQGELEAQQPVLMQSNYGRFYYQYSTNPDDRTSLINGVIRFCKDGETVEVP